MRPAADPGHTWLLDLPPSRGQTIAALSLANAAVIGFFIVLPVAGTPLVQLNAFFPSLDAIVCITDLVSAVLLFAQYSISRARSLLALAGGYLFTALIVVPHALTFSGAFSPSGLLGANIQTGSWLFIFWHLGFAVGLLAYALLREKPLRAPGATQSARGIISMMVTALILLVCGFTWLSTAGATLLPPIILDSTRISPVVHYPIGFTLLVSVAAFVVLLFRRARSGLDQWLMVVVLVYIGELVLSGLVVTVRFSLAFYAARFFSLITSSLVLIVLLAETTRLYGNLVRSNAMLRREQNSKLMNLEVMAASITHEVRQPLTAINAFGQAALQFLRQAPPNIREASASVDDMLESNQRADEIFKNIRTLFGRAEPKMTYLDLNALIVETLANLRLDLESNGVETELQLDSMLPRVRGNKIQLQEVLINLVRNAIEAMESTETRRALKIITARGEAGNAQVEVRDSGRGFSGRSLDTMFDAFATTKSNGMGLGLTLCRLIVTRHGGSITAALLKPNGAAFHVSLPAAI